MTTLLLSLFLLAAPSAPATSTESAEVTAAKKKKPAKAKKKTKKRRSKKAKAKAKKRSKKKRTKKKKRRTVKRFHMTLHHANTKERLKNLWVIRRDPKNKNKQWVGKRARKRLTHFLRDWRTGRTKYVPERLVWYLYLVQQHYDAPIEIVSGYRHKERKTSRHKQGRAVDFRVVGVSPKELWKYCKRFDSVGVGHYPTSRFVHLDVRKRSHYWVDDSGPGEDAEYRDGVAQRKQKRKKKKR
jgi:uncharacterized protein YcbK (DUF882 family)